MSSSSQARRSSQRTPASQRSSQRTQPSSQQTTPRQESSQRTPRQQNSQRTPRQQATPSQDISTYDIDRMVTEVVQYLLITERKGIPVKKADITKLIELKGSAIKTFKAVMEKAGEFVESVFGFHLYEFEGKSGFYVLQNQVGMIKGVSPQDPSEANTILFLILSTICLSDGEIMEDEVWNMLNTLGYKQEDHKKLVMQDFVKQLYLDLDPVDQDPPQFLFKWGERALVEFKKMEILEFASEIYGQPVDQFGTLYVNAKKEEREREQN